MYRQPSEPARRRVPAVDLPWNRAFGWAVAPAGLAAGLMSGLESPELGEVLSSDHPWWLGLVLAIPLLAFGLAFAVNRTRLGFVDDQLTVSNHPLPLPRTRRYPLARVDRVEVRAAEDADRLDLVAILDGPPQAVVLYAGVADRAQAGSMVERLEAALLEARGPADQHRRKARSG